MSHAHGTRVQEYIGDPVSDAPPVGREKLEEIFQDIQADLRFDHELNGCLNCGTRLPSIRIIASDQCFQDCQDLFDLA